MVPDPAEVLSLRAPLRAAERLSELIPLIWPADAQPLGHSVKGFFAPAVLILNRLRYPQKFLRIRANPTTAAVPIIALTAHALPHERTRALEAGCIDYDTKPVELDRLLGKMTAILGKE